MVVLKNDKSSHVIVCVQKAIKPDYLNAFGMDCFSNEVHWLNKLGSSGIVPKILSLDRKTRTIVTEYVGEPVRKYTLPPDWQRQRDRILGVLAQHNCRHNDIKPSEILVLNGRLMLIDFGWASLASEPNPKNYPPQLGLKWRCPSGYDDRYSFNASIASLV